MDTTEKTRSNMKRTRRSSAPTRRCRAFFPLFTVLAALMLMPLLSCAITWSMPPEPTAEHSSPDSADSAVSPAIPDAFASPAPDSVLTGRLFKRTFADGTRIMGVDVGGMTRDEARRELNTAVEAESRAYECRLSCGDGSLSFTSADMTIGNDLDEVLDLALSNGSGSYEVRFLPEDGRRLRDAIEAGAAIFDEAPREAELLSAAAVAAEGSELMRNSRFAVTAPKSGRSVDREAAAELILSGAREAELPFMPVEPEGAVPPLPQRRAFFSTSYNSPSLSTQGRVHNIKKAAALLDSRALKPGETLSCNAVLGERTKQNGWMKATAFALGGRQTEQQYGGGICQISTTLYNCAIMADLEVPKRTGHSRKISYAEGGRDASLSWGGADLVIENSTDETIYIFMWKDDEKNCLCCEIYGEAFPEEYDEIRVLTELIETIEPGEPEFTTDASLKEGECVTIRKAIRGSVYQTYREYLKNGTPLSRKREPIARTAYLAIPALYAVPLP